jgi:MarR family transcriptional regulator for hemolysin
MTMNHLDLSFGHQFSKTYRKLNYYLFLQLKPYDITTEQWVVLCRLGDKDGINQKDLSIVTEKDQPTLTRILDCLDKKNLIERKVNTQDRRSFLVFITSEGQALLHKLVGVEQHVLRDALKGISNEHIELARQIFATMNKNMEHI